MIFLPVSLRALPRLVIKDRTALCPQFMTTLALLTVCGFTLLTAATGFSRDGTVGELSDIDRKLNAVISKFDASLENLESRPEEVASKVASVQMESVKSDLQKIQDQLNELTKILSARQSDVQASTSLSSTDKKDLITEIRGQLQSVERIAARAKAVSGKIAELPAAEKVWNEQYSSFSEVKGTKSAAAKVAASIKDFRITLPRQERAQTSAANHVWSPKAPSHVAPTVPASDAKTQADRSGERYPQTLTSNLSLDDVERLNSAQLRYAINEIYARHGLVFRDKQVQKNFERMKWYSPQASLKPAQIEERFTPLERANLEILAQARDGLGARSTASAPAKPQNEFTNPIAYFSACQQHVADYWRSPFSKFSPGHSAIAVVEAVIGSDGHLVSFQWIQRSGHKAWDEAVVDCLQRIPPFPAPPNMLGRRPAVRIVFPET